MLVFSYVFTFILQAFASCITQELPPVDSIIHIPRVFHTIWFDFGNGPEVPQEYKENIKRLLDLHPGWDHWEWKEKAVAQIIKTKYPEFQDVFFSYNNPVKKHDAARIAILNLFGGVYLDHDFFAVKNIEPLLRSYSFVIGNLTDRDFSPANAFIAATSEHRVLKSILNKMNDKEVAKRMVMEATGNKIFEECIKSLVYNDQLSDIKVYSQMYFYPLFCNEKAQYVQLDKEDVSAVFSDSYLVHEFGSGWTD